MKRRKAPKPGYVDIYALRTHNSHYPCFYHIIYRKNPEFTDVFGTLKGNAKFRSGESEAPYIELTQAGKVVEDCINKLINDFPVVKLYAYSIMPNHFHVILRITKRIDYVISHVFVSLRENINVKLVGLRGKVLDYEYKPLPPNFNLNAYIKFLSENPRRLAMRVQYPYFFTTPRSFKIKETEYKAFGNLFLLRNPDKFIVKVPRDMSEWKRNQLRIIWRDKALERSMFVSPFLTEYEKKLRKIIDDCNGNLIHIISQEVGKEYYPCRRDYELCSEGRMLIVSLHKNEISESLSYEDLTNLLYELADLITISY